ncbi:pentapeptide repeat-containing protein, partial [Campylobacter coli]|nr:pentapeptide repeat-containing protein [Campylobacter coli]
WKNKFKNRCYFVDSKFGYKDKVNKAELNFSNAHFEDNAYFNNSEFYNYADFHECKFDNIACFYGVKFYKAPNFSACYFKEQKAANLINVDIDELNFESVEKYIKDNYQDETYENKQEITEEQRDNNCKLKCAKHLKDSFRVIKDILITQNNALEAQEWHKLELYAKEKEIAIKAKSAIDVTDCKNASAKFLKEELYDFTEWVNFVLLFIYRNASSHHTSFLKILNFTVVMIALYASFVWWLQIDCAVQFVYEFIFITAFIVVVIIAFLSYIIYKSAFKLRIFRFLLFLGMGCGIFLLFFFQNLEPIIIYCYILLVSFFSWIFFSKKLSRFFVLILAYIVFFSVLIEKPQFINPFTGVFSSDKLYESQFEKSLNDLNTSAIINLASISQNDFNLHLKDQNISFTELNSAKVLIVANKEKLKEVLSKVYNDKHVSDYKKVLSELENNTSNVKNIIEEIDNKNNNSVVSAQLNKFLKLNFSQEIDSLYMIKRNFSTSEKLSPEQMALFDQKDSQDKLKNVLSLLKFKSRFEGVLKVINRDEIIQNTIKSTSVLYGIILLLCIFSLQKTARKNSIVPS